MVSRLPLLVIIVAAAAGCAATRPSVQTAPRPAAATEAEDAEPALSSDWRTIIRPADLDRLGRIDAAWAAALTEVNARGRGAGFKEEGALLDPAAALPRPAPPPGSYMCRTLKLGTTGGKGPAYTAFKPFFCYIAAENALLILTKQTGSQRPAGRLWDDSEGRLVFLGAMELDAEKAPPAYGADEARDVVGVVERIGPFRWRMVMPWPQGGSKLDLLELVPAPVQ